MRTMKQKSALLELSLAASVLLLAGGAASAQTVNLTAAPTQTVLPDGNAVPMWGLFCGDGGASGATCAGLSSANATAAAPPAGKLGVWSPPIITVPYSASGTSLTINLTNSLSFPVGSKTPTTNIPTSLVIVGQLGGGLGTRTASCDSTSSATAGATCTPSPDHTGAQANVTWPIANNGGGTGTPPAQAPRVQSFATEVAAGTQTTLTWASLRPGTYLIESGTHPSIQGPMGLYGILVVTDASTGTAYPKVGNSAAVTYSADVALLLSEIDPVQNTAVSTAVSTPGFSETMVWSGLPGGCGNPSSPTYNQCYPPAVNYTPLYYLFNGRAFDKTSAASSVYPFGAATPAISSGVLVRLVNAGLRMHVPAIVGSTTGGAAATPGMTLIAEDGNLVPGAAHVQSEVFMAAGKTYDVMINAPAAGAVALPVYDRELSLSANSTARDAGMLAYIGAPGASAPSATQLGAAIAKDDPYNALIAGQSLTISDPSKGVIANDTNVQGVTLLTGPSHGTVTLNQNGTFTYVPNGAVTSDSFTYCANGTVASGTCSSGVTATVTLGATTVTDTGISCLDATFTSSIATQISIKPPGVLKDCKDGAGLALTVKGATSTAPITVGSAIIDINGGLTASGTAKSQQVITVPVQNALGTVGTVKVTLKFPDASGLKVTVVDGADHSTPITDYRWVIEEDRTFYVDPKCTTNPLPAGCPTATPNGAPVNYGTNFHTSYMPLVAAGCTGALSCEGGQTLQGTKVVCDVGNGVCRPGDQQAMLDPSQVYLDPTKRYYISVLPGDAANPFIGANLSAPTNCANGPIDTTDPTGLNTGCGHGMGGAPIAAGATAVTVLTVPTPLPTATLSVFVFEDDWPLNGEYGAGGGVDVLAPNEPGLGGFQVTIFDQAGGTGDATGQPTYDMFNQPLSNSLAGTIDPVTGLDACPVSNTVTANMTQGGLNTPNATDAQCAADPTQKSCQKGVVGMIVTCPKFESDGKTLSPMAGQAIIKNMYPGRYGVSALPGADRIALGEEWVQTNTLDGQKAHDSFMRVGEPGYFQEFGPAGYHVSIGFANPKLINERRYNSTKSGLCDTTPSTSPLACNWEVKGHITTSRLSRTPDQRLYGSGDGEAFAFTQCYISLGDPDGATIAFTKCDANGNFDFTNIPPGNWELTSFDQWNDLIVDGITTGVGVGCSGTSGLCDPNNIVSNGSHVVDMGEMAVHQWHANIYTRTFIDMANTGVSDDSKPGLAFASTNIRFRDGSFSNFNNTDLAGNAGFNEVFPLFNWYVIETDTTRYKSTGVHVVYDAGGPADGTKPCADTTSPCGKADGMGAHLANTYEKFPLPADLSLPGAVYCNDADCSAEVASGGIAQGAVPSDSNKHSTGRIDSPYWFGSYGWQGYIGQSNFLEWGKKPYNPGETGPIHGHVVYASTRPFDDPQLLLQLSWEPLIPHVRVNLYQEGVAKDGVTPTLTLVDHTETTSFDDWVQGFRKNSAGLSVPNINCPGQTNDGSVDPFWYGIQNQPQYLDWYNNALHGDGTTQPTPLPYQSQFKCYDGMHSWNQLQPAPYDGMYSFPSVTGFDPKTGQPAGSNCTVCTPNPSSKDPADPTYDPYNAGMPMLPPGKYVVEVVVPPGYELVKEEDKNILIGDNYIAPAVVQFPGLGGSIYILPDQAAIGAQYNANNAQNSTQDLGRNPSLVSHEGDTGSDEAYWPCVGTVRQVPDFISLFPQSGEVAPFAGAMRPLCDRKEVNLTEQSSALVKFYLFTSTHVAAHFTGIILDDFTAEFDPFSPQFGEKFAPSYLPVGIKDWTGNEINRVYADQFGIYNGLNYSTWEVNPPNPTGYGPTMMVMCMNDAGMKTDPTTGQATPDPLFQPGYSQFCYELPFMPGQTGYFDTPVVPVSAFSEGYNHPDCSYPDATPAISTVAGDILPGGGAGPWVSAPGNTLTINALGDQSIDWYGYSGPSTTKAPFNQQKIKRHYGFGGNQGKGSVTIGGLNAPVTAWSDTQIKVTVPAGVPACAVQQQAEYGGSTAQCGQLIITTDSGKKSVDTVTVTVGGKTPKALSAGASIQSAIDAASPGDMIIVPPGTYNEMLIMWKPIRLQGVGAAVTVVDANTQPAGKLLTPWRQKINCIFGLTPDGRPRDPGDLGCAAGLNYATNNQTGNVWTNFPSMVVDRLPFEATLGWDATLNGNLAEQLSEPSLMGAYEGAAITVLGKGVKFPSGTGVNDALGATTGAAFPTNTKLLSTADCTASGTNTNPYPTNFFCNPSSIDGLGIRDSSQGGGGIFVHAYGHKLQIANNRVGNNTGTMSGGITIGQGEHPDVALGGAGVVPTTWPTSCESSNITNQGLPFCFNNYVNIHNNAVVGNSSMGDELFSSTPAGAGGVAINTGADYYSLTDNWVCGNVSTGDGGGVAHIGFIKNGDIEHNTIIFNQSTNPTIASNGGGLIVMGAPDADPTSCGVATDQDCAPPPGTITPSDGSGPGLKVNGNLILGNAADAGSGGGLRLQHVNGTDVLNNPNGAGSIGGGRNRIPVCTADLATCLWNSVSLTNNIVVNNVAGWDGAGVSLLDSLAVNIVNNTIASNDSTASSGTLFQTLYSPFASSQGTNCTQPQQTGQPQQSCPQVSGLVSIDNSAVLKANIDLLPPRSFRCPAGHGTVPSATSANNAVACYSYSIPLMFNDAIWQNRSFYIGVGSFGSGNQSEQKIVSLYNSFTTTQAGTQTYTGDCTPGGTYWELGFRGDTGPANHTASGFTTYNSLMTSANSYVGTGNGNLSSSPAFVSQYCNGSRTPPEAGGMGWAVPPGTNESNATPNPVFSLTPAAVVDEGNNWINLRWGPLSLTTPVTNALRTAGATLGDFRLQPTSGAIDSGSTGVKFGTGGTAVTVRPPSTDFFGNARPTGAGYEIGAVEMPGPQADLSVTKTDSTGGKIGGGQKITWTIVVTNSGPSNVTNGTVTDTLTPALAVAGLQNISWTCVPAASCTAAAGIGTTRTGTVTLIAGASATFTLSANAPSTAQMAADAFFGITSLTNSVTVAVPTGTQDPNTANNTASDTVAFVVPAVTSVNPASAVRGTQNLPITITGSGFTGATGVGISGGITCANVSVSNDTTVTATCNIPSSTALGSKAVTVTGGTYGTATNGFGTVVFRVTGAQLTFTPSGLTTTAADRTTKNGTVTVTNGTNANQAGFTFSAGPTIARATGTGTFSIQPGGTCTNGATINPGGSCTINVRYVPPASPASVTSTATVTVAGAGLAATTQTSQQFTGN